MHQKFTSNLLFVFTGSFRSVETQQWKSGICFRFAILKIIQVVLLISTIFNYCQQIVCSHNRLPYRLLGHSVLLTKTQYISVHTYVRIKSVFRFETLRLSLQKPSVIDSSPMQNIKHFNN